MTTLIILQNQMQMYPPYFMSGGLPQGQRAYFPTMTSFRPWQGGPVHRGPYSFVPGGRRGPMGPRGGQMGGMSRANNPQQRMGGGGGQRAMQQQGGGMQQQPQMKFSQGVRNPPAPQGAPPATSAPTASQAAPDAAQQENFLHVLTQAKPHEQKQIIGEQLYRQIFQMHPELTGKITGKLMHCLIRSFL